MQKVFTVILRVLAGICAVLFILTAVLALLAFNAERRLFDTQLYLRAFESQRVYERLPALAAETITASESFNPCEANPVMCASEGRPQEAQACLESALGSEAYQELTRNRRAPTSEEIAAIQPCLDQYPQDPSEQQSQGGPPSYMKSLSAEDWQAILSAILPPEMTKSLVENALNSVFAYFNGKTDSATLSLVEFKAHVNGPVGIEALMQMARAQPPCTAEQITKMTMSGLSGEPELILCNPPEEVLNLVQSLIQAQLQTAVAGIPDTATLIPANEPGMENPLQALRAVRAIMRFSPLLPLGLLFLIAVFAARTLRGWLNWWGFPLVLSGLAGLATSASINPIFKWVFAKYAQPKVAYLPASVTETGRGVIGDILSGVAAPIAFQSAALLLVGIILILATRIKQPSKAAPHPQDTEGEISDERINP